MATNQSFVQTAFTGGEWSKSAQGRMDKPEYKTAMNACLNGLPLAAGAWVRRPGTRFAGHTRKGRPARVYKFDFQAVAPYTMEFTDGFLRFRVGSNLVVTNDTRIVSAFSTVNPAKITTSTVHGWATDDQVIFGGFTSDLPSLQNRQFGIIVVDTLNFTLYDPITGIAIDAALFGSGLPGTVSRIYDIATTYKGGTWRNLRSVQTEKQAFLLNGTAPQTLNLVSEPAGAVSAVFSFGKMIFLDGPFLDPVPGGALATPSALKGIISLALSFNAYDAAKAYKIGDFVTSSSVNYKSLQDVNVGHTPASSATFWQIVNQDAAINNGRGFLNTDVGRHIRFYSEPLLWAVGTAYAIGNIVTYNDVYWIALATSTGNIPGQDATKWGLNANSALWTWGRITGFVNLISGTLAGSTNIGTMTDNGGLAAIFDGTFVKADAASARHSLQTFLLGAPQTFQSVIISAYGGKNYTAASAQKIASATIYPSSQSGFFSVSTTVFSLLNPPSFTVNLRAKQTLPANAADGIILGTATLVANQTNAISIASNDTTTAWNFVWPELKLTSFVAMSQNGTVTQNLYLAQIQYISPSTATGNAVSVEILGKDLLYSSAIRVWRLGVYSDTTGYPTCGTYAQGRLWLSGAVANRVDASRTNQLTTFSPTEADGVVAGSNGLSYIFNAPDANPIFWMVPDLQGIIAGTAAGEWLIRGLTPGPLTATNIDAARVTAIGCANIEPRRTEHTTVFVQRFGRKVMEYFADVYSGKFSAPDLSQEAKHLTVGNIAEIGYQHELVPTIWARREDGVLIGATYKRDTLTTSKGPDIIGWHKATLGSGRSVQSISVGPSVGGSLDSLTMVTLDSISNISHVEVMTDVLDENLPVTNARFLDSAVNPTSQIVAVNGLSVNFNGLWHLNGKTVSCWAGGLDCGDYLVTAGTITVVFGDGISGGTGGGLFTLDFLNTLQLSDISIGFTYSSRGQILRPQAQSETGTIAGPGFAKMRREHQFGVLLQQTAGISFGTDFTKMRPALFESPGRIRFTASQLFNGIWWGPIEGGSDYDGMIAWEIARPYPAVICAIGGFLQAQDK